MKKWIGPAVTACIIVLSVFLLGRLVAPKYVKGVTEGAFIKEYYNEKTAHSVIILGDCEVYENFSPVLLWQEFGINSYIRGSAQQLLWQSYYLLEDTLKYETPEVVVLSVLAMKYNEPQNEAYNRITLDGMKWGAAKIGAIRASMTEDENFLEYVFPVLRYHERITDLRSEDITYMFSSEKVSHNGYYLRMDVKAAENIPVAKALSDYDFGDNAWVYLNKIKKTCDEKGIRLVLIKAPSLYPYWYPEWEKQIEAWAHEQEVQYINYLEISDELGLDFSEDTYDGGLHLNLYGAEKITKHLGKVLSESYGLTDRREDEELSGVWEEKIAFFEAEKQKQLEKIAAGEPQVEPNAVGDDTKAPEISKDGFFVSVKGTKIYMNMPMEDILEKIGEPQAYFEAPSCAFQGLDKVFTYDNFEINTYQVGGKDYVSSVLLTNDLIETPEGIYIGCETAEVRKAYGEPDEESLNTLGYEKQNTMLRIIISEGLVSDIQICLILN